MKIVDGEQCMSGPAIRQMASRHEGSELRLRPNRGWRRGIMAQDMWLAYNRGRVRASGAHKLPTATALVPGCKAINLPELELRHAATRRHSTAILMMMIDLKF